MPVLIAQPPPLEFPLRVPVAVAYGPTSFRAEVLGASPHVMLLQATEPTRLPPLGTRLRLHVGWDRQQLHGRVAAHGVNSRFLVSLGERAIRGTRRFPVDLPATLRTAHLSVPGQVRIVDLSTSGARVEGPATHLPVGAEVELRFTPPGQSSPITVHAFVTRKIADGAISAIGVAFGLASPALDFLEASQN